MTGAPTIRWVTICDSARKYDFVAGIKLSRNFGHQSALLAGLSRCTGDVIVTMDGDLQHPPALIPKLLEKWRAGYDLVNTRRVDSDSDSGTFKSVTSKIFYRIFSRLTDVHLQQGSSDFRMFDRRVLEPVLRFRDVRMFFRGAFNWVGFISTTVPYNVRARQAGVSKYSLLRMIRFAIDATVAFSTIPLRISIAIGFLTSLFAFLELIYVVAVYLTGGTVQGWASTTGILSLLFGVLFVQLGIVGIYLSRIHEALQDRPRFIVAEEIRPTGRRP